jgi:hypothetical protein
MSTKHTLSWNSPNFPKDNPNIDKVPESNRDPNCPEYCLYEESFEEDGSLYLDLRKCEFEATQDGVTVKIPIDVWNRIIKIGERNKPAPET